MTQRSDAVAIEEPMEIRLVYGAVNDRKTRSLSITMRTPGNDFELAVGFLVSEAIVRRPADILEIRFAAPFLDTSTLSNLVEVQLAPDARFEMTKLQRNFFITSSCGICGKVSLDAIRFDQPESIRFDPVNPLVSAALVQQLPTLLRSQQAGFQTTGGLHASALTTSDGQWIAIREDVGRHNAVDKVIGSQLLVDNFPLTSTVLLLSGRASFELMQKALMAQIPIVIAVGAPSSLAIELANEFGMTLIGFTSQQKFNVYSGVERVRTSR
jgi:FdhD protein